MPPRRAAPSTAVPLSSARSRGNPPRRNDDEPSAARVRASLLAWFDRNARELPWRTTKPSRSARGRGVARRDPWLVWVSEIMLQQTRVEAVVEPYRRFVTAFPTLEALARADQADVLARWSGLGYYRRARLLHDGARYVLERCDGRIPRTRAGLEDVPGIGSYTAGAILSIAFGQREAALDANVTRVVARLWAVRDPRAGRAALERFAAALADCERPGDVNEALMDLGSAVCTSREARCPVCPLRKHCRAAGEGLASTIGAPQPRKAPRPVSLGCAVVRDGDRVLFLRRPADDALLADLWDLPTVDGSVAGSPGRALRTLVKERSGFDARLDGPLVKVRHDIVGRRIEASVYVASVRANGRTPRMREDARMMAETDLAGVGVPALPVKILKALLRQQALAGPRDPSRPR
jgi:A/G-specific adenine glycosylase